MDIIGVLLLAWILTLFGFDDLVIRGVKELFGREIGEAGYYLLFIIAAILLHIFSGQGRN